MQSGCPPQHPVDFPQDSQRRLQAEEIGTSKQLVGLVEGGTNRFGARCRPGGRLSKDGDDPAHALKGYWRHPPPLCQKPTFDVHTMRLYLMCKLGRIRQVTVQLETSRRERKKRATHRALHDAAFLMVEEHGLAAATIEAIADRADVSTRTFFNYFSSKEDAVLDRDPIRPDALRQALLERPAGEDVLTALRRVMEELVAQEILNGERLLRRMRLIRSEPLLRGAMAAIHDEIEEALVAAVAKRTGRDPNADLYPALVVSAALGAFKVALLHWSDQGGRVRFDRLLTAAFDLLAVGLADTGAGRS